MANASEDQGVQQALDEQGNIYLGPRVSSDTLPSATSVIESFRLVLHRELMRIAAEGLESHERDHRVHQNGPRRQTDSA
jgi:hypothetical protein